MNQAASIIRCAPTKRRKKGKLIVRLAILLATSAAAGWLIHLSKHPL